MQTNTVLHMLMALCALDEGEAKVNGLTDRLRHEASERNKEPDYFDAQLTEDIEEASHRIDRLERILTNFVKEYVQMIDSGDCGNWNPRTEEKVKQASEALGIDF